MPTDANTALQASVTKGSSFLASPAAPTLATSTTGGTVAAGTYLVEVSYVDAQGETTPSAPLAIVTTGATSTITINSPSASGSATGWYAYVTQVNGSSFTRQQTAGSPTAIGTNLVLTAPPTNTGAAPQTVNGTGVYTGTALTLPSGTPRRGLKARVLYPAASNASGSNTVVFQLGVSHDGGNTFPVEYQSDPITLSTTAQSGEIFIPFEVSPTSVVNQIQLELICVISGSGSTPTITYQGDITLARP